LLAHRAYCSAHNQYNDSFITDYELGPTPWSLVPYYVATLRDLYSQQNIQAKTDFLKNLVFLSEPESSTFDRWPRISNLKKLDEVFIKVSKDFFMPLMLPTPMVERALEKTRIAAHREIDYVVIGRSARERFATEVWQATMVAASPADGNMVVVELGRQKYFFPSDVGYDLSRDEILKNHRIRNLVYVSCDVPEVASLLELQKIGSRVTFVRDCQGQVEWSRAFEQGLPTYLAHHLEVEFIEFNLSAIRLAKRLNGTLRDVENMSAWQKWLKWQKVVADEEPKVSRPLAVIDGVRRFRMIH
jgi:hypothetical protein